MGLASRLKARLTAIFASAEDPHPTSTDQRQIDLLGRLRAGIANISSAAAQLQEREQQVDLELPRLWNEARQALREGNSDGARSLLVRRQASTRQLEVLRGQIGELGQERDRLVLAEQHLLARIEALRVRQEMASARYSAAEAQMRISESLASMSRDFNVLGADLDRTEAKTEVLQMRTESIDVLFGDGAAGRAGGVPGDPVERELQRSDDAREVDRELAALRIEMEEQ